MHWRTNDMDANEVADEIFESLCSKYLGNLKTSMRGSDFIFDSVQLIYYKCYKVIFWRGNSYIGSKDWIKKKNATINPKNAEEKRIRYVVTFALNYGEIKSYQEFQILNHV